MILGLQIGLQTLGGLCMRSRGGTRSYRRLSLNRWDCLSPFRGGKLGELGLLQQ